MGKQGEGGIRGKGRCIGNKMLTGVSYVDVQRHPLLTRRALKLQS